MDNFGILSLLPPLLAIIMAIVTKQTVLSLFVGILVGATMLAGWNPLLGLINAIGDFIVPSMGDSWNASVLLLMIFIGPFALILERGGGASAFADKLTSKVTTRKQGTILTWLGGVAVFFSDSSNPVIVGPIFRPITDRLKISREKLAYIVDSTSATMPALLPFTAWGAYIIGIIRNQFEAIGYNGNPMAAFVEGVPYQYYTIGAVIGVFLFSLTGIDFGPMKKAEDRAFKEGKVISDSSEPIESLEEIKIPERANPTIWNMLAPIIILIILIFAMFLWTGGFPERGALEALGNANSMLSLNFAFFIAGLVALFLAIKAKVFKIRDAWRMYLQGIGQMIEAILVLILAWALGSVCKNVGTSDYVVNISQNVLTPSTMLLVIFIASAFTGFTTGTSWGTFAIFIPIAIPLAISIDAPIAAAVSAAISGGIFGDHCSPISDTTILSSMGSSCHHIDHVTTQLPYAAMIAIASAIGYVVTGFTSGAIIGLIVTLVLIYVFILLGGKLESIREKEAKEAV